MQLLNDAIRPKRLWKDERLYDRSHPNYHFYDFEGVICAVDKKCTLEQVATFNRMHPAPGTFSNTIPVKDGLHGFASLGSQV